MLITLDTTRADHLGPYGYEAIETPTFDRIAERGTVFEQAFTPVPITLPSHLSIMSGTTPLYHGVHENNGFYVAEEIDTLAEVLSSNGYDTAAFVGAFPLDSQTGLDQGFDLYDDNYPSSLEKGKHPSLQGFYDERPARDVVRPALQWLRSRDHDQPFFIWTHYFDAHQPQEPPSPYREQYADQPYDGEIASVDEAVGQLVAEIEQLGELDNTIVIVTADHGEGLGEHGELTHALLLYSTTIRVPLIWSNPNHQWDQRVSAAVGTIDIMPTLLDLLDLPIPDAVQGELLPRNDAEGNPDRQLYAETWYGALMHGWSPLERLTGQQWMTLHGPSNHLYDYRKDPNEINDLIDSEVELAGARLDLLDAVRNANKGELDASDRSSSPDKLARLASLGYIGASSEAPSGVDPNLPDPIQAIAAFREMNEGKQLFSSGNYALAIEVLQHALSIDPGNQYSLQYLAMSYMAIKDFASAENAIVGLLDADSPSTQAYLLAAQLALATDDSSQAVQQLSQALESDPRNDATRQLLAQTLAQSDRSRAIALYRELTDDGDNVVASNALAVLLIREGRTEAAIELLERAIASQPFYAAAYLNRGVVAFQQDQLERSLELAETAISLRPMYWQAIELKAIAADALGKNEQASSTWAWLSQYAPDQGTRDRAQQRLTGQDVIQLD
ncbi:MAG: hypothetical protein DHS20C11_36060 [Lysobacteraceae bacterium]|nr:MAG: hypothetical protein DHS20C11_36060 [Xanthomonadaceae bacterium]